MAYFAEGAPCWTDVTLPDVEAGKRFYGELLDWTFEDGGKGGGFTTLALLGGKAVGALAPKPDGRMPTVWNIYFATSDAMATCTEIRKAGGQVITEPMTVGDLGVVALAADPGGAVFGLWQAAAHPGFALRGRPGSYAWTEVYTRDKDRVDHFYEQVFGYGTQEAGFVDGSDFRVWSLAGRPTGPEYAIGGLEVMSDAFPAEVPPHFLVYFAVEDCDAAVRATVRLGGRVTREPVNTPYGRHATLVDDQGAHFAVIAPARNAPTTRG